MEKLKTYIYEYDISKFHLETLNTSEGIAHYFCYLFWHTLYSFKSQKLIIIQNLKFRFISSWVCNLKFLWKVCNIVRPLEHIFYLQGAVQFCMIFKIFKGFTHPWIYCNRNKFLSKKHDWFIVLLILQVSLLFLKMYISREIWRYGHMQIWSYRWGLKNGQNFVDILYGWTVPRMY